MTDLLHGTELKIGYLIQNGAPDLQHASGAQLHITAVIRGLINQGHEVCTVAPQNHTLGWSNDLLVWQTPGFGISQHKFFRFLESLLRRIQTELRLPYLGLFESIRYADACRNCLAGFDVLYERHGYLGFGGVIAARWLGIPLVLELNGNILKEIDERNLRMSSLQRKLGRWITICTLLAADRIVAVSDALGRALVNDYHIPSKKIVVVPNGVDIELFSRQHDDFDIRSKYKLGSGPIVGFVGTFEPWHGVDLLVESFQDVERRHPDAQLVIIGEGQGKEKAVARTNYLGLSEKVTFLGQLPHPQVAEVLGVAKVLVAPYPFEYSDIVGTPLKIMEYMAAGKGIVASTMPLHEMIEHEVTGLRVKPADAQSLADGINRLLEEGELNEHLGKSARIEALRKHSWNRVVDDLEGILLNIVGKKKYRVPGYPTTNQARVLEE